MCESPVEFILKVDSPVLPSRASKSCHGSGTEELGLERKLGHTQPGLENVRGGKWLGGEETLEMQLTHTQLAVQINQDTRPKY